MYRIGGSVVGTGLVGGAGLAAGSGASPSELARTGAPLLVLTVLALALLLGGFVLLRGRLRTAEEA